MFTWYPNPGSYSPMWAPSGDPCSTFPRSSTQVVAAARNVLSLRRRSYLLEAATSLHPAENWRSNFQTTYRNTSADQFFCPNAPARPSSNARFPAPLSPELEHFGSQFCLPPQAMAKWLLQRRFGRYFTSACLRYVVNRTGQAFVVTALRPSCRRAVLVACLDMTTR